ncbi:hypothetical protein Slu03_23450 [Sediminihabitans luteus]|nr:hypothetical protein Slu03_23450 [Sediminihabitans luteus]
MTGAGGSIGSEIVRQVEALGASSVHFVDNDEFALYSLELSSRGSALLAEETYRLADIRDVDLMDRIFREVRPDVVFHAAAHKHLPLLERAPEAAVKTNVFGTESVVRACVRNEVPKLVNISTDKAANPTSVLGWSKRLAEQIVRRTAIDYGVDYSNVRFGNVLGSRGSFLPTLAHQIGAGLPVRITDPDVTRYFMSIPEAAGLVIEAGTLRTEGSTFVLDMGEPVRILRLVEEYVRLSGLPAPTIEFTGLRPGEKLHEELFSLAENHVETEHPRIRRANVEDVDLASQVARLRRLIADGASAAAIRNVLAPAPAVS